MSCERAFNPKLDYYPCAVLSNNDGCIVARSEEVKALGVPMGAPLFKWQALLKRHQTKIFSANFALYGDISNRIMNLLDKEAEKIEVYSIDEAFLYTDSQNNLIDHAHHLRKLILKCTGIPTSIGIAETKTLAKLANHIAKKQIREGVFYFDKNEGYRLRNTEIAEIWGIGRRLSKKLNSYGIYTAHDLCARDDDWLRKKLSIAGLRTILELRGKSCSKITNARPKRQSICCSRSFGDQTNSKEAVKEALASFCSRAAEKLRSQKSLTSSVNVFLIVSKDSPQRSTSFKVKLESPTAHTVHIIQAAYYALEQIYKTTKYKKVGVILSEFSNEELNQKHLFLDYSEEDKKLMKCVDRLNSKFAKDTVRIAASGIKRTWSSRRNMCSPRYTTSWDELLEVG